MDIIRPGRSPISSPPSHTGTLSERGDGQTNEPTAMHIDHGDRMSAICRPTGEASAESLRCTRHDLSPGLILKSSSGGAVLKPTTSDAASSNSHRGRTKLPPRHDSPTVGVPNTPQTPSKLRQAYATDSIDHRNSDPFLGGHAGQPDGKPLSPGATVVPWDYQQPNGNLVTAESFHNDIRGNEVQAFIDCHPPPKEPKSPKTARRSLRTAKSDLSIRTSVTIAPSMTPKRLMSTENPDSSPLTYISKLARSPALPSSPADPHWDEAIGYARRQVAADQQKEEQKAPEETFERKLSPDQVQDTARRDHIEAAKKLIRRSSMNARAPTIDYSAMSSEELEAYRMAIQEEIARAGRVKGIRKLFKQVTETRAKADVLSLAWLNHQISIVDIVVRAKALKPVEAARQAEADHKGARAGEHITQASLMDDDITLDSVQDMEHAIGAHADGGVKIVSMLEKEGHDDVMESVSMRSVFNDSPDNGIDDSIPEDERNRDRTALSASSPASDARQPIGLGISSIDGVVSTRDSSATARLSMPDGSQLSLSQLTPADDGRGASVYSQNSGGTLVSHLNSSEVIVFGSSLLRVDRFDNPNVFSPRRDSGFTRIITEARRKRALEMQGSHPAMRGADGSSETPEVPPVNLMTQFTASLPYAPSELSLKRAQAQWRCDSILRGKAPDEVAGIDILSGNTTRDDLQMPLVHSRPQLTVNTSELFPEDEGYHTAQLSQQHFSAERAHASYSEQRLADCLLTPHDVQSFFEDSDDASDAGSDRDENTDNPDYASTHDEWDKEEDNVATPSGTLTNCVIDIDIDEVIANWQHSTSSNDSSPDKDLASIAKCLDVQALRSQVGLPPLKLRTHHGEPKHPNHGFAWRTEKLMCSYVHNPPSVLPRMPQPMDDSEVHITTLPVAYAQRDAPKVKLQRCSKCTKFCCLYAENLLASTVHTPTEAAEHVRQEAAGKVDRLRMLSPNGVEAYSTFLTCMECSHVVCPSCATVCDDLLCRQVLCNEHSVDGRCAYHQSI